MLSPYARAFCLQDPEQLKCDVKRRAGSISRLLTGQGAHSAGKEWGLSLKVSTSSRERESLCHIHVCIRSAFLAYHLDLLRWRRCRYCRGDCNQ